MNEQEPTLGCNIQRTATVGENLEGNERNRKGWKECPGNQCGNNIIIHPVAMQTFISR